MNRPNVKPQGLYIVWGYWLPQGTDGHREHVATFGDLSRCIEIANEYATKTLFAHIRASSGTLVYDTRYPEQRQAERCAVCRIDMDKGAERVEEHGLTFDSIACLIAWEEMEGQR